MFSARGYLAEHNNEEEGWFKSVVKKVGRVYAEYYEDEEIVDVTNEQIKSQNRKKMAQINEELAAAISDSMVEVFNLWKTTCTEEQKAAALRKMDEYTSNPNFEAEYHARQMELFTAADANSDGLLDAAEYVTYYNSAMAEKTAAGEWTDPTEDRAATQYALMNRVNPAQDGITYDDVKAFIAASMPKMAELRAAEGL